MIGETLTQEERKASEAGTAAHARLFAAPKGRKPRKKDASGGGGGGSGGGGSEEEEKSSVFVGAQLNTRRDFVKLKPAHQDGRGGPPLAGPRCGARS